MQVYIMRGLPGAGKSSWITSRADKGTRFFPVPAHICSADNYQVNEAGIYEYKVERVKEAHKQCFLDFMDRLQDEQIQHLFVDNTNTTVWEIAPYYQLAEVWGRPVKIVHIDCSLAVALKRNVHDVPGATIWRMQQNLLTEKLPPHWHLEILGSWF